MAKKRTGPSVLTANLLLTGAIVFWTGEGWSRHFRAALRATTDEGRAELDAAARVEESANRVTGAYLVVLDAVTGEPVLLREQQRVAGPSVALPVEQSVSGPDFPVAATCTAQTQQTAPSRPVNETA